MSISVTVTPVVGLPSLTGWAQVVRNQTGELICSYSLKSESAHNLGRDLADFIAASNPFDAVTLHQFLLDVLSRARRAEAELQIACVLVQPERLFLAATQGQILYRSPQGEAKILLTAAHEPQLIEGKAKPGAAFVAATQAAATQSDRILELLNDYADADTSITTILPTMHANPDSDLSALAFVQLPAPPSAAAPTGDIRPTTAPSRKINLKLSSAQLSWAMTAVQKTGKFLQTTVWPIVQSGGSKLWHRYQATSPRQKRKLNLAVGGTVVLIGIGLGLAQWQGQKTRTETVLLQQQLAPFETLMVEARQLENSDPVAARDKAQAAQDGIQKLVDAKPKSFLTQKKYAEALLEAQTLANHVSGLKELQNLPVVYDLRLIEPNFLANKILIQDSQAYFLDRERKQFITVNLEKKQSSILPIGTLNTITDFAVTTQNLYLLSDGIQRWQLAEGQKTLETLKAAGDSDKEATFFENYSSYLYTFNPAKRNVFRYTLSNTSAKATQSAKLSEPIGWIVNKKDLDFSQVTTMAVDGDIWLGTKTGTVLKYTSGQPVAWKPSGLQTPLTSSILLDTSENLSQLYVLEAEKQRLIVFDKSGQFLKELKSPTLASVTTFAVSETLKKAFLVSGSIVYELAL